MKDLDTAAAPPPATAQATANDTSREQWLKVQRVLAQLDRLASEIQHDLHMAELGSRLAGLVFGLRLLLGYEETADATPSGEPSS